MTNNVVSEFTPERGSLIDQAFQTGVWAERKRLYEALTKAGSEGEFLEIARKEFEQIFRE